MPSAEPGTAMWRHIAATLAQAGCDLVTGVPSDEPALLDAALAVPGLKAVPVRDQRAGACLAAGHALVSGNPAVLATNSGPSLPNALAGLLEAASLHAPVVVVTTRIPRAGLGRGGFQQVDQRAVSAAVAKWYVLAEDVDQLDWALRQAVHRAINGAPGVVVVELAEEALQGEPPQAAAPTVPPRRLRSAPAADDLDRAVDAMARAAAPVIIAGGGAKAAGAGAPLRALAETWGAAVFATAAGRGVLDEDHPRYCGLAGLYSDAPAAALLDDADVILALGTRLEETVRTGWTLSGQRLIHVDVDPDAFDLAVRPEIALAGDAALTAGLLAGALKPHPSPAWSERIAAVKTELPHAGSLAAAAVRAVGSRFGRDLVLVQENGLHDMWSYHYPLLSLSERAKVVAPGEQTMMGFGVAASLGAALAEPSLPTVVICGDGAMTMSMNALPAAAEHGTGIVFVVFENGGFGWPRYVRALAGADTRITRFPGGEPPYEAVIRALGGWTTRCRTTGDLGPALEEAAKHAKNGALALVAVPVSDTDIPPGVLRVYGGAAESPDKADDHDA
ncbi:thiamine pyrophosphate-binding protein [Nonomuraea endophytica]|uniref:thiamine pyrophosphate-binding protein n=1 Tax=Nonomuraea endophytica TaxID=714136 RepID=UPI0037C89D78